MRYQGRVEAGQILADTLHQMELGPSVIAGIPRGGVVVAASIATRLGAPLTAVHARTLSSSAAPEVAFGAIDEDGQTIVDPRTASGLGLGSVDVGRLEIKVARELVLRRDRYPGHRLHDLLPGRTLVLVDDGLATGFTMRVAVAYAQRHGAKTTVVAVPCASSAAAHDIRNALRPGDDFVCPLVIADFRAVGDYYDAFPAGQRRAGRGTPGPRRPRKRPASGLNLPRPLESPPSTHAEVNLRPQPGV